MKNITFRILIASFAVMACISETRAEIVTTDEALVVANNWINTIIRKKGSWGDADDAHAAGIKEFKSGERMIGYFCDVKPVGYIVVSLRKELAPVKAYSARNDLDPDMDEGTADLLKERMERILDRVEKQFGSVTTARSEDVSSLFEVDYKEAWEQLETGILPIAKADVGAEAAAEYVQGGNYQEGDELIDARWHQGYPYNLFCPAPPPGSGCTEDRCTVGCNATAGSQVLHYWAWPPTGVGEPYDDEYQWWYMPNQVFDTSPIAQIIAVSELCYEVGIAGNQAYCVSECATAGHIENMRPGYINHFRYNPGSWVLYRAGYSASAWFNVIKAQLNKNLPMTYGIAGHAIICDGWQVVSTLMQIHMNWGSGTSSATRWYTLDVDWPYDPEEHLLGDHYPIPAIGSTVVAGTYPRNSFPYRYFDQDATAGLSTTFTSGNYLQFLHGIRLRAPGYVRIESSTTYDTRLFSRGDTSNGIRLSTGTMTLNSGGSVKLY